MQLIDLSDGWKGIVSVADTIEEVKRVPIDKKYMLMSIRIINNGAEDAEAEVFISEDAAGATAFRQWHETVSPGPGGSYDWQGFLNLKAGDRISVRCDSTEVQFHISGVGDLEDPPV